MNEKDLIRLEKLQKEFEALMVKATSVSETGKTGTDPFDTLNEMTRFLIKANAVAREYMTIAERIAPGYVLYKTLGKLKRDWS